VIARCLRWLVCLVGCNIKKTVIRSSEFDQAQCVVLRDYRSVADEPTIEYLQYLELVAVLLYPKFRCIPYSGSVRKPQTPFVFIDTNTNFCAQNPFHNLFVCVFEHKLEEFVRRSDAAYQSFRPTQTQTQRYV
jgi:hypothetical protein